jgi:hypothetical protein
VIDRVQKAFSVHSDWFSGNATINTFQLEELLGTKLRALYQRSKGRDVFDLWLALNQIKVDITKTIQIFRDYMSKGGTPVTRELFEKNLDLKLSEHHFLDDIGPLLSPELKIRHAVPMKTLSGEFMTFLDGNRMNTSGWSLVDAAGEVKKTILRHLP